MLHFVGEGKLREKKNQIHGLLCNRRLIKYIITKWSISCYISTVKRVERFIFLRHKPEDDLIFLDLLNVHAKIKQ